MHIYLLIGLVIVACLMLFRILEQLSRFKSELMVNDSRKTEDLIQRLALIDEAQKRLHEVSNSVLGLQAIFNDKRARGAVGEMQLTSIIANMLPSNSYSTQYQLSNGSRCDCMLFLPEPTGNVAIDAKFPLENYQKMQHSGSEQERTRARQLFVQDVKKHINAIADKYIIANETAEGAIMFIPAEAIFAEIHNGFAELINYAQNRKIWLTSPTTLMAVLTTAASVLKDQATKKHINCIQEHLRILAKDFQTFEQRFQKLSKHLEAVNLDAKQIETSANKITKRFVAIEQVEIETQ